MDFIKAMATEGAGEGKEAEAKDMAADVWTVVEEADIEEEMWLPCK